MKSFFKGLAVVLLLACVALWVSSPAMLAEMQPLPIDLSPGPEPLSEGFGADGLTYQDDSIKITGQFGRAFDTDYLLMHVKLTDASQMRTAAAGRFTNQNATLGRTIAKRQNAVLAINGDFFAMDSYSVAIRQGKLYRNRPTGEDVLFIDEHGDFHVQKDLKKKEQVEEALTQLEKQYGRIINAFTFGPLLVENGVCAVPDDAKYTYFNVGAQVHAQRISFTQVGRLEYLIIATEGPDNKNSRGMTLYEIAKTTEEAAKDYAPDGHCISYNLDGGSSSTVIFNNKKINAPGAKSRTINDIIYFATLVK